MKKWKVIALALIIVSFAANLCWWQAWQGWQQEEKTLKSQLGDRQQSLTLVETTLTDTQLQFADFKQAADDNLQKMGLELEDTKSQFKNAVGHVFLVADELQTVQADLASQKTYYEERLLKDVQDAKKAGYQEALASAVPLRNPTYSEAMELAYGVDYLAAYREKIKEKKGFVCVDYAEALDTAAAGAGIHAGVVFLVFRVTSEGKWGHFLNCFDTVNKGRVFFDPMLGDEVTGRVKEGSYYRSDLVKEIIIYW